jgi:hypothetical protein
MYRRLSGSQSQSRRNGEEKNLLPLAGNRAQTPDHPAYSVFAIATMIIMRVFITIVTIVMEETKVTTVMNLEL